MARGAGVFFWVPYLRHECLTHTPDEPRGRLELTTCTNRGKVALILGSAMAYAENASCRGSRRGTAHERKNHLPSPRPPHHHQIQAHRSGIVALNQVQSTSHHLRPRRGRIGLLHITANLARSITPLCCLSLLALATGTFLH